MTYPLEQIATIDSTNSEAMRRIQAGVRGPLWLLAREQTAGKGRAGRGWSSEPGNFYGSLILPLACSPTVAHHLSLLTGIAVVDALDQVTGGPTAGLRLKWPNDVMVGPAKLAGILLESTQDTRTGDLLAVIGIGINVASPPKSLGRPVVGLPTPDLAPVALIRPLSQALERWLGVWQSGKNFAAILEAWLARAGPLGEAISVNTGAGPVSGQFAGLDGDGALLLRVPFGDTQRFTFGDVTLAAGLSPIASGRA
jgi:BirA family transcriptional regulator, biotin operon repressor / biotin---[acetyl-CoA-carboxylase] ligase